MLIIPEIQLQDGKVVTRSSIEGSSTIHDITPQKALEKFTTGGAQMIQIVDVDAARSQPGNNIEVIQALINQTDVPVQVAGGIRTMTQINDWFEVGAARVVLGTIAITDTPLVVEAANRHPGGIIVHLATRDGYVMIDGWKTQTAFQSKDLIRDLCEILRTTKGGISVLPRTLGNVLNSQACRSKLHKSQCLDRCSFKYYP